MIVPDKRGEDHVDALLHSEEEVALVLLGDGGQVAVCPGEVAALPRAEVAPVLELADDEVVADLLGHHRDEAVVDEDALPGLHHLGDVDVVQVELLRRALLLEGGVGGQGDLVAGLELELLPTVVLKMR